MSFQSFSRALLPDVDVPVPQLQEQILDTFVEQVIVHEIREVQVVEQIQEGLRVGVAHLRSWIRSLNMLWKSLLCRSRCSFTKFQRFSPWNVDIPRRVDVPRRCTNRLFPLEITT